MQIWICDKAHTLVHRYVISLYLIILPYRVSTYIYIYASVFCVCFFSLVENTIYIYVLASLKLRLETFIINVSCVIWFQPIL